MAATPTQLGHVGWAKEVTPGTYVAPTLFIPYTASNPEDVLEYVNDESADANGTHVRGVYQGVKDSTFDLSGNLYPEVIGALMVCLGLADTVTGAGPYTHTFKMPAAYVVPPSASLTDFNTVEARGYPGQKLSELKVVTDAKGTAKYTSAWMGFPSAAQSTPTPSYPATPSSLMGWETAVTVGGTASDRNINTEITVKRNVEAVHSQNGVQAPREMLADAIEASFSCKSIFDASTDFNHLLSNDQPALQVAITTPGGGSNPVLTLKMSKVSVSKAKVDRSGKYAVLDWSGDGIYNATDAGPIQATLLNAVSTQY
jgi:hypothetical protein